MFDDEKGDERDREYDSSPPSNYSPEKWEKSLNGKAEEYSKREQPKASYSFEDTATKSFVESIETQYELDRIQYSDLADRFAHYLQRVPT